MHANFHFYYDRASQVALHGDKFVWQDVYHRSLLSLRDAVLRRAYAIKRQYTHRAHTHLTSQVPEHERKRFKSLIEISIQGSYTLSDPFQNAITAATQTASERQRNNNHRAR